MTNGFGRSHSITDAEARALVTSASSWFVGLAMTPDRLKLWASALVEVPGLQLQDAEEALRVIATCAHGERWRLEISEWLEHARIVMRRRQEREAQDLSRKALAAKASTPPGEEAVTRARAVSAELLEDLQDGRVFVDEFDREFDFRMRIDDELRPFRRVELPPRERPKLPKYTGPGCYDQIRREMGERAFSRAQYRPLSGGAAGISSIGDVLRDKIDDVEPAPPLDPEGDW